MLIDVTNLSSLVLATDATINVVCIHTVFSVALNFINLLDLIFYFHRFFRKCLHVWWSVSLTMTQMSGTKFTLYSVSLVRLFCIIYLPCFIQSIVLSQWKQNNPLRATKTPEQRMNMIHSDFCSKISAALVHRTNEDRTVLLVSN